MALVVFRSRAASEIIMFADNAHRLLEIIGKAPEERGVIAVAELGAAVAGLQRAVEAEAAPAPAQGADQAAPLPVSLRQRAYPLLQMLRAAQARGVDVTWGI